MITIDVANNKNNDASITNVYFDGPRGFVSCEQNGENLIAHFDLESHLWFVVSPNSPHCGEQIEIID